MAFLAVTTLSVLLLPQNQGEPVDARLKTTLSKTELGALNREARKWVEAHQEEKNRSTVTSRKKLRKALKDFKSLYDRKNKDNALLKHMGDVLAIFDGVFPYERVTSSGEVKRIDVKAEGDLPPISFPVLVPRSYDCKKAYRSVLVLRGWDASKGDWQRAKSYLETAWKKAESLEDTIFLVPDLRKGDDYDGKADLATEEGRNAEQMRLQGLLDPFGALQRRYNLDRNNKFLDCGPGTAGMGFRLATYFPHQFAGLIVRQPVDVSHLQLDGLAGMKVLLVSSEKTKEVCTKLEKALNAIRPDTVTIVGEGDNTVTEIDKWMRKRQQPLFPQEVVVAPNHDSFNNAYWVDIIVAEPLDAVGPQERPIVRVKADREKNQIVITSRSVSKIGLNLNDALLDLDKPVTIVVNGVELPNNKIVRSLNDLQEWMFRRFDPTFLYPAYHRFEIPKE